MSTPLGRLRLAFGLLATLVLIGSVGYRLVEDDFSLFDGFYMTLITISTVGFGEIHDLSPVGRLLTAGLIMSGLLLVGFATGSFVESVVEGGFANMLGRRRLERQIEALEGHWILCGFGRIGQFVASELAESSRGLSFVVVDSDPSRVQFCEEHGYLYMLGDATQDEVLESAGVKRAKGLMSLVATDAQNVYICLTARQLNPRLSIIARALDEKSESKLRRAGANQVVSPYRVGGLRLSQAILRPTVQDFLDFTMGREMEIELDEVTVRQGSELVGQTLRESAIRGELNLIVLAVKRGSDMEFNPGPDMRLCAGDTLIAVGADQNLRSLEARAHP